MEEIYSKVDPNILLHIIYRMSDITEARTDVVPKSEFLQLASFKLAKNKTFRPHKHKSSSKVADTTQESWVCIKGAVRCIFYDLDDAIIAERDLAPGDCSITLRGGHNYVSLEEGTLVYEFKTGPYFGQELDKIFIE